MSRLMLKKGARLQLLVPQLVLAVEVLRCVLDDVADGADCVVTSGTDGAHAERSDHYTGHALDFRTRHLELPEAQAVAAELTARLGPDWVVLLESDHLHVAFRPKRQG